MQVQTELITVAVNGERRQIPPGGSVSALLDWLEIAPDRVAVEVNQKLVRKADWAVTRVEANSQIEVVEFVGGG